MRSESLPYPPQPLPSSSNSHYQEYMSTIGNYRPMQSFAHSNSTSRMIAPSIPSKYNFQQLSI